MKKNDIFDDIIAVLRQAGESSGGAVYLKPETRQAFFAASHPSVPHSAAPASSAETGGGRRPEPPRPVPAPAPVFAPVPETAEASPAPAPAVTDFRRLDMNELADVVSACRLCPLCQGRTQTVFGAGDPHAELMFIGEGPGRDEDQQGIPFVGAAGKLLTKMIAAMQFSRDTVFIANIVKCRPPNNRNPEPDEAGACLPYLRRQIELIQPKVIVLLGAVPLRYLLGKTSITRERGRWDEFMGIPVMPTFHPAYLLRYEAGKKDAWSDLQQVMKVFGKVYRRN